MASRSRAPQDARRWVERTDLLVYLRCPYAWWRLDQGQLAADSEVVRELLAGVVRPARGPVLENPDLEIRGALGGVEYDDGALWPIEARSRAYLRRDDRLALAFDWLLLEPGRSRRIERPTGLLILHRDGQPVELDVVLGEADFRHVEALVERIREARRTGVERRPCGCPVCRAPQRDGVRRQKLTRLFELGKARAAALEEVGIADLDSLGRCDPSAVATALQGSGVVLSASQIEQMLLHLRSYREGRAILVAPPPELGETFLTLDLEYDTVRPRLWLIGLCLVDPGRCRYVALWADDEEAERDNLERLAEILADRPEVPLVTWAGTSADVPQLLGACRRLGLDGLLDGLERRHVDLFVHARQSLRLPMPDLSLGTVAAFFGVDRASSIPDGRAAQSLYARYRRLHSLAAREAIRSELTTYNRDDLEALVETLREIQQLPVDAPDAQAGAAPPLAPARRRPDYATDSLWPATELG